MKKLIGIMMVLVLLLAGCGSNTSESNQNYQDEKKQSKIEIYSVDKDELLQIIDNQNTVNKLLDMSDWEELDSISANLMPEYLLLVYQEKTLLYGQDPNEERDYELIETVITYEDSSCVTEIISNAIIKNMIIPESALTFHYTMPDDISNSLHELIAK